MGLKRSKRKKNRKKPKSKKKQTDNQKQKDIPHLVTVLPEGVMALKFGGLPFFLKMELMIKEDTSLVRSGLQWIDTKIT